MRSHQTKSYNIDADDAGMVKEQLDKLRYDIYQKYTGPVVVTVKPTDRYSGEDSNEGTR